MLFAAMGNCLGTEDAGGAAGVGAAFAAIPAQQTGGRAVSARAEAWARTGIVGARALQLRDVPDAALQLGPRAKTVDLADNRISRVPEAAGGWTNATRIAISNNELDGLPGAAVAGWSGNLRKLVLDRNRIQALPDAVGNLAKLEELDVSGNALAALPRSVGGLAKLRVLLLARNRLTVLAPELGLCLSLEVLDANDNAIAVIPSELGKLQRLKCVQLNNNRVAAVPPELLHGCANLHTLELRNNPIDHAVLSATDGFEAFEARRKERHGKMIDGGVMLGSKGLDEGVDRRAERFVPHT